MSPISSAVPAPSTSSRRKPGPNIASQFLSGQSELVATPIRTQRSTRRKSSTGRLTVEKPPKTATSNVHSPKRTEKPKNCSAKRRRFTRLTRHPASIVAKYLAKLTITFFRSSVPAALSPTPSRLYSKPQPQARTSSSPIPTTLPR